MNIARIIDCALLGPQADAPNSCGVYVIVNTHTRWVYVGQSQNIKSRWGSHRNALEAGRHSNKRLQDDWSVYGPQSFRFHVALLASPEAALAREKALTNEAMAGNCYNHSAAACPGRKSSSGESMAQKTIRLPPDLWAKIDAHGLEWLRAVIKRAKPPG